MSETFLSNITKYKGLLLLITKVDILTGSYYNLLNWLSKHKGLYLNETIHQKDPLGYSIASLPERINFYGGFPMYASGLFLSSTHKIPPQ